MRILHDVREWEIVKSTEQSGVYQTIATHPLSTQRVSPPPPPPPKAGGGGYRYTHSQGGEGVGVIISEEAWHWIGLLQYNPSATQTIK